ncbi:putative transcription factor AP2-EREBP family [Medicago truncatula]|uniref:Ethylene response factor n=1 Tax=Medicago truncatula TaxID=3880 RepID=A0A072TYS1_MEDTR|nr:ethylene response factor [Medicago truncatula]RHN44964.1 putative transcription factor AP2-EREBP family [Medicago truncatula]
MTCCSNPTSSIINVTTTDQNPNSSNNKIYRGVRKRKWVSEIRLPNSRERIWLGSHDTQEKAARAFDAALYCLRGPHASFNFPNTPLTINVAFHG